MLYLLILTVTLNVKEPVFATEKSTFAEPVCRDALVASLPDQGKDVLSGAIMIAQRLHPLNSQVTLYHVFLAAMTEVHVDGGPITYTNSELFDFLRRQNLLEDFQNFLLNNLGLSRDRLGSLFDKRSDGTLIFNTDKQFDHNTISNFSNYTPDTDRLLTEVTQKIEAGVREFSNDFFISVLKFDNPIRRFFFERTPGRELDDQKRTKEIESMYRGTTSFFDEFKETIPANPIIAFDFINRKMAFRSNNYRNPSPYFSAHDLSLYPSFLDVDRHEEFRRTLEQQQALNDSNRFIRFFKKDGGYVYGKIVSFVEDKTSLIVESLDGQRYTYDVKRANRTEGDFEHEDVIRLFDFLYMKRDGIRLRDTFDSMYSFSDVSVSITSKKLFDMYEDIRELIGYPMPLNQHTPNLSVNLFRGLFNLIALNHYLKEHYPELEVKQVSLNDFDENRHFVSFLNLQDERVPGKLIEVNKDSVIVEDLNGHRSIIEGKALNTILQDQSLRLLFQYPSSDVNVSEISSSPIIQREGEGFSYAQLEMSGDPAQDAFRKALIAGRFEGDERFISFLDSGEKRLGKVIEWKKNELILQFYRGNGDMRIYRLILPHPMSRWLWSVPSDHPMSFMLGVHTAVSKAAKDYFERIEHFLNRGNIEVAADEDYQFLSRAIPAIGASDMTVDLTDPSLRKWVRRATDIIKEKTGIIPGPQDLTASQRVQIYHIFHNDIVPLIEDTRRDYEEYGDSRDLIISEDHHLRFGESRDRNVKQLFRLLGHVLDTKSAVCAELSAFGAILFSEYGLHTKYMSMFPQTLKIIEDEEKREYGHAWISVQREDGSSEFIDTNSRIFWSTNLRLLREVYSENLSHLSDDQLLSLSEEYTLVIPPSLPE